MIGWAIMGEVDTGFALISVLVVIGLAYIAVRPPEAWMSYAASGSVVGLVILYPIIRSSLVKRAMFQIDLERLERLHEQVRMQPNNHSASFKIAEAIYNHGYYAHGFALAKALTTSMPAGIYDEERKMYTNWQRHWGGEPSPRSIACLSCGTFNGPGSFRCPKCGADYILNSMRGVFHESSWIWKLSSVFFLALIGIFGIPIIQHSGLPRWLVLSLIVVLSLGAVYLFVRVFRKEAN